MGIYSPNPIVKRLLCKHNPETESYLENKIHNASLKYNLKLGKVGSLGGRCKANTWQRWEQHQQLRRCEWQGDILLLLLLPSGKQAPQLQLFNEVSRNVNF